MNAYTLIVVVMLQPPHVVIQHIPFATKEACETVKATFLGLPLNPPPRQVENSTIKAPSAHQMRNPYLHVGCHPTGAPVL